jgi:hypothetical protein
MEKPICCMKHDSSSKRRTQLYLITRSECFLPRCTPADPAGTGKCVNSLRVSTMGLTNSIGRGTSNSRTDEYVSNNSVNLFGWEYSLANFSRAAIASRWDGSSVAGIAAVSGARTTASNWFYRHVLPGVKTPMESLNALRQSKQTMFNDPTPIDAFAVERSRVE